MKKKKNRNNDSDKSTSSERERLIDSKNEPPKSRRLKPHSSGAASRKISVWAPTATATTFEDLPVLTICPYCNNKGVTKTHLKRSKKRWFCCWCLPMLINVFKDVIHSCPKCNKQIAIYNRFHFFKRNKKDFKATTLPSKTPSPRPPLTQPSPPPLWQLQETTDDLPKDETKLCSSHEKLAKSHSSPSRVVSRQCSTASSRASLSPDRTPVRRRVSYSPPPPNHNAPYHAPLTPQPPVRKQTDQHSNHANYHVVSRQQVPRRETRFQQPPSAYKYYNYSN